MVRPRLIALRIAIELRAASTAFAESILWRGARTSANALLRFLENPLVSLVLSVVLTFLMIPYPTFAYALGLMLLLAVYRSKMIAANWRWFWQILGWVVAASFIFPLSVLLRNFLVAEVVPRPYIHIDRIAVSLVDSNGFPLSVKARISGHNVSSIASTGLNPIVNAAIIVRPIISDAAEEKQLFADQGQWVNQSFVGLNRTLNPLEGFEFTKDESLVLLDDVPFSFKTAKAIERGDLVIYVVTKAIYYDRYGPLPDSYACSVFAFKGNFTQEECLGTYQK